MQIDPQEIAKLRIPSRHTLDVQQFVPLQEIDPAYFEKPYFVIPENDQQAEAFAVVRRALLEAKRVALGKIALSGREHLLAITAPNDDKLPGLMAYTLRYAEELRNPAEYFEGIKTPKIDEESLSLAKELIQRKAAKFNPEAYKDEYETALRAMIEAKLKHLPMPEEQEPAPRAKVINLMDALRRSVDKTGERKPPARASGHKAREKGTKAKVTVMQGARRTHEKRRKTA